MRLNVYLFFNGTCEEAVNFYAEAIPGTTIGQMMRFGDSPMPVTEGYKNKIMHGTMNIKGTEVMFSDANEAANVNVGDNFAISLDFDHDGDMKRTYDALSGNGGRATMPIQDTFWGATFGMCVDKYGVTWMFNHQKSKH